MYHRHATWTKWEKKLALCHATCITKTYFLLFLKIQFKFIISQEYHIHFHNYILYFGTSMCIYKLEVMHIKLIKKTWCFCFCFIPCWPLPLPLFLLVETQGESYSSCPGTYPLRWQWWPLSWNRIYRPLPCCSSRPSLACTSEGYRNS